jgi:hypothetical protein
LRGDGRVVAWGAEQHDSGQADVPYLAQSRVVAIAAGDQLSIALRDDGTLVAWGNVPSGTSSQLDTLNANRNVLAIRAGAGIVVALTKDAPVVGTTMPTRIPTQSPQIIPTLTLRPSDAVIVANQIGWFSINDRSLVTRYTGVAGPYTCAALTACPQSDPNGMRNRAARFNDTSGDELNSTGTVNLTGTSFTVSYWMRRDRVNTNDVALSIGTTFAQRKYFTMGIDNENRIYCSFYGDDLRTTSWYTDNNWHHYACTFDKTSLVRKLYRDGVVVASDVASASFSGVAAPVVIGRRNDNASGLAGSIDNLVIHKIALTDSQLLDNTNLPAGDRLADITFDDIGFQSLAPNRTRLLCTGINACAEVVIGSHDDEALAFTGTEQMQLSDNPVFTNGFTVAYWAKRSDSSNNIVVVHGTTAAKRFTAGFNSDNKPYCAIGATKINGSIASDTNWHFYVCRFDKNAGKLGLSVDAQNPQTITASFSDSGTLFVGRAPEVGSGFKGQLDD